LELARPARLIATQPFLNHAIGTGAHSVAVDGPSGQVYVPFQAGSGAFPNGGISVFTVR
jgi:hypothetical protein